MADVTTYGGIGRHGALRAMLLGLFVAASLGTLTELLLLEHYEDWQQWIPLVLLGAGVIGGVAAAMRPGRRSLVGLRALMVVFLLAGAAGLYLHYSGNVEFELEMSPELGGLELVWEALRGATPALAPGTMFLLGGLGLVFTYRHPALDAGAADAESASSRQGSSRHREETSTWT